MHIFYTPDIKSVKELPEEDITKINMRSCDDEADMKSYKLLFKIRDENDYLFQAISNMVHLLSRSETSDK